mmetsp:Transcript_11968/g.19487  ORF Transcript_11968/g.19487 Transcript_11968/m.19487 type:complete len:468 (-) Transcript_11968:338-1741(-)|eukprot:CAMPEP_0203773020 /NCGR_PEP_ID=MMETSP0099_2-20121227/4399_1 /ASSEMBLY_ACC=CAM_ASM_000209 /TAXON_ID=96639 /ORGANISM=" , Strain NY0313808BC1" /LENGTH=467 /DNA_ID=CAMNT_0050670751 /DNA_START=199 /DNA_END=1602 /DNA_ORIENTATION=+
MELYLKVLILGTYGITWLFLMWPNRLGRPIVALAGAALATLIQYFGSDFGVVDNGVDLSTLALLLGQFILAYFVVETGVTDEVTKFINGTDVGGLKILRFGIVVAVMSPFLMNDTVCLFLTRCSLVHNSHHRSKEGRKNETLSYCMALAIATCSNLGSAITTTGNPQNALVLNLSKDVGMSAGTFIAGAILPSVVGILVNLGLLMLFYNFLAKRAQTQSGITDTEGSSPKESTESGTVQGTTSTDLETPGGGSDVRLVTYCPQMWFRALVAGTLVVLIVLVTALKADPGWSALGCGVFLILATWTNGEEVLQSNEMDYPLILLFVGQFILVQRLVDTGVPQIILDKMLGGFETLETGPGLLALSGVVVVASNILSNVPVILMISESNVITTPEGWLAVAWFSTVAGNLLLLGSAANVIVARRLEESGFPKRLSAQRHALFGIPSTLVIWAIGVVYFEFILPKLKLWG